MSKDPREALSAFLDGEDVPARELTNALSLPNSREMLVDFVLLRAGFRADESWPGHRFQEEMETALAPPPSPIKRFISPVPLFAALGTAAVLMVVVLLGRSGPNMPPPIDLDPPAVDRVLSFEQGVDWHEGVL